MERIEKEKDEREIQERKRREKEQDHLWYRHYVLDEWTEEELREKEEEEELERQEEDEEARRLREEGWPEEKSYWELDHEAQEYMWHQDWLKEHAEALEEITEQLAQEKEKTYKNLKVAELSKLVRSWADALIKEDEQGSQKKNDHDKFYKQWKEYRTKFDSFHDVISKVYKKNPDFTEDELHSVDEIAEIVDSYDKDFQPNRDIFDKEILPVYKKRVESACETIVNKPEFAELEKEYSDEKVKAFYESWGKALDEKDYDDSLWKKKTDEFKKTYTETIKRDWDKVYNKNRVPQRVFTYPNVKKGKNYKKVFAVRENIIDRFDKYSGEYVKAKREAKLKEAENKRQDSTKA